MNLKTVMKVTKRFVKAVETSRKQSNTVSKYCLNRGHRELLDERNFTTVAIVKLCCHNFTQIANCKFYDFFLCLLFLIDLLTYPY